VRDVAELTGVTTAAIRQLLKRGRGPVGRRVGTRWKFDLPEVTRWLVARQTERAPLTVTLPRHPDRRVVLAVPRDNSTRRIGPLPVGDLVHVLDCYADAVRRGRRSEILLALESVASGGAT